MPKAHSSASAVTIHSKPTSEYTTHQPNVIKNNRINETLPLTIDDVLDSRLFTKQHNYAIQSLATIVKKLPNNVWAVN